MNLPAKHKNVLKLLAERLVGITWMLIGSTNLAAQGVSIEVHDIDLLTDKEGAYEIGRRLHEFIVQPVVFSENERFASHFGRFLIDGVEIEVMGDLQNKPPDDYWGEGEGFKEKLFLDIDGTGIPAATLRKEYTASLRMGRLEKAEKIKKAMKP